MLSNYKLLKACVPRGALHSALKMYTVEVLDLGMYDADELSASRCGRFTPRKEASVPTGPAMSANPTHVVQYKALSITLHVKST